MSEEETGLRVKALEAIRTGKLPDRPPDRTWGGHGNGKDICRICGNPLNKEDITFDLEYDGEATDGHPACYSVHLRCFNAWDLESQQRKKARASHRPSPPDHNRASLPAASEVGTMPANEGDTTLISNRRLQLKDLG